ncbi:MAG: PLP-dependent transferase [Clostridia bacterium]|nr:PLP-dependent transferase [Clostridia bacterium]
MKTPICDFVNEYIKRNPVRTHMPGHKGVGLIGIESFDLTEMEGADDLYHPEGIIKESEKNASLIFGCDTCYSTEGSSQCIRAMMYLCSIYAAEKGEKLRVLAGRNAHKTFLSAAALLDIEVEWLVPKEMDSYLSVIIGTEELENLFSSAEILPHVLYLTDPDYLGNKVDVKAISSVCKKYGVLLAIDNAHGAYLKFLSPSQHPIDFGADICCDSAHKTLPALTGSAYLHISDSAPIVFKNEVKNALSMFGSTSPSYIILQSLDKLNRYLSDGYKERLSEFIQKVEKLKAELELNGYKFIGDEKIKLTFDAKKYGYEGDELAEVLLEKNIVTECHYKDYLVMMLTPETGDEGLEKIKNALLSIEKKSIVTDLPPKFTKSEREMSIREAMLTKREKLPVEKAEGKILAEASVGCPPAVPILVSGELITKEAIECFKYYGINEIYVRK